MLEILLPILCTVLFAYLTYILVRAYRPDWFAAKSMPIGSSSPGSGSKPIEPFVQKAMGPPTASPINMPPESIPSPAPPVRAYEIAQEPRTVAAGGPGAPNAQGNGMKATMSPEVMPVDPFQDSNMEAPITDSMRHPELSFGPGMDNSGIKKAAASGVMNTGALSSESPFSPEFAQNGGQFMGEVTANDLSHDDTYATA